MLGSGIVRGAALVAIPTFSEVSARKWENAVFCELIQLSPMNPPGRNGVLSPALSSTAEERGTENASCGFRGSMRGRAWKRQRTRRGENHARDGNRPQRKCDGFGDPHEEQLMASF